MECFGLKKIENTKRNVPTKDTHQPREKYSGKIGWNGIWVAIKLSFGRVTFTRKIVHSLTHSFTKPEKKIYEKLRDQMSVENKSEIYIKIHHGCLQCSPRLFVEMLKRNTIDIGFQLDMMMVMMILLRSSRRN